MFEKLITKGRLEPGEIFLFGRPPPAQAQFVTALPALPGRLLLGHLSEVNNRPEVASAAFSRVETGNIPHTVIPQGVCGPLMEL